LALKGRWWGDFVVAAMPIAFSRPELRGGLSDVLGDVVNDVAAGFDLANVHDGRSDDFCHAFAQIGLRNPRAAKKNVEVGFAPLGFFDYCEVVDSGIRIASAQSLHSDAPSPGE